MTPSHAQRCNTIKPSGDPPFGGREEDGIESNFPQQFRTRETADLFLALIIRLLKPGGRAAVVLPDGTLFGEGVKTRLKEHLMTVATWLAAHPSVEIIARDRGGGYGAAAAQGRSEAKQVADRWHLMENASAAFLIAVKRRMRDVRRAFGQDIVEPATLTAAERIQYDGWKRRAAEEEAIRVLHGEGVGIKEIVRRTGRSRKLVRDVIRGGHAEPFRPRASSLEPWLDRLHAEWNGGCRNGAELWRRLRATGFPGSLRVVTEWATRQRRADAPGAPSRCPAPRALARLLTTARDKLTRTEAVIVATAEGAVPDLVVARSVTDTFHALIRERDVAGLDAWIEAALASPLESFAKGVAADRAAIAAAIETPWSNGQTEGQICRLKTLKRQMGGRANVDLLKARMLTAA